MLGLARIKENCSEEFLRGKRVFVDKKRKDDSGTKYLVYYMDTGLNIGTWVKAEHLEGY